MGSQKASRFPYLGPICTIHVDRQGFDVRKGGAEPRVEGTSPRPHSLAAPWASSKPPTAVQSFEGLGARNRIHLCLARSYTAHEMWIGVALSLTTSYSRTIGDMLRCYGPDSKLRRSEGQLLTVEIISTSARAVPEEALGL